MSAVATDDAATDGVAAGGMAAGGMAAGGVASPRRATRRANGGRPYDMASLMDVAVAEFNQRGYDATSMEDLSRAAGITKSSFYHHVSGKEALLHAALQRALDGLFGVLDEPATRTGTPLERLRHMIRRQIEVLIAELPYVTLLLRVRGNTETERWALQRRRAFDAAVAAMVRDAVDAGQMRGDIDPARTARLLSGLVNSIAEWYRPGRSQPGDLAEEVTQIAFEGLLPR
jgi:AcrR family transcriptional regulator